MHILNIHRDAIKIYSTHNSAINPFWHHDIGSHVSLFKFPSPYLSAGYSSQYNTSLECCKSIKSNQIHKRVSTDWCCGNGVWPFSLERSQTVTSFARLLLLLHQTIYSRATFLFSNGHKHRANLSSWNTCEKQLERPVLNPPSEQDGDIALQS